MEFMLQLGSISECHSILVGPQVLVSTTRAIIGGVLEGTGIGMGMGTGIGIGIGTGTAIPGALCYL